VNRDQLAPQDVEDCRIVQQYGSERTGTVLLQKLLLANLDRVLVVSGGKHAGPDGPDGEDYESAEIRQRLLFSFEQRDGYELVDPASILHVLNQKRRGGDIRYVISVRHPHATALSWLRRGETLEAAVHQWNRNNARYFRFFANHSAVTTVVDLEDLVRNPEDRLRRIAGHFDWPLSDRFFTDVLLHSHAEGVLPCRGPIEPFDPELRERAFDREHELAQGYLEELGPCTVAAVSRLVDTDICAWLGYAIP